MQRVSLLLILSVFGSLLLSSCSKSVNEVKIGKQVWMTENLNVDKFRNGDPIPQAKTDEEWEKAGKNNQPAWCYYDNDPDNDGKYGKLYNWYALNDSRGLVPAGWHVPSYAEWDTLMNYLGGEEVAGRKMKNTSGWGKNRNGTNESGFSGLPGGGRNHNGIFYDLGKYGGWWSSTENLSSHAWSFLLGYGSDVVGRYYYSKEGGLSIRCIKD